VEHQSVSLMRFSRNFSDRSERKLTKNEENARSRRRYIGNAAWQLLGLGTDWLGSEVKLSMEKNQIAHSIGNSAWSAACTLLIRAVRDSQKSRSRADFKAYEQHAVCDGVESQNHEELFQGMWNTYRARSVDSAWCWNYNNVLNIWHSWNPFQIQSG
jgi:hypothetical protein